MVIEIIYTATDAFHNPQKPRLNSNLLISHESFVAVDCTSLPKWYI
jgi:hypothetical protein